MHDDRPSPIVGFPGEATRAPADRRWLALLTLCLAVLVAQLDTSVVNLAVRPIGTDFRADVGALQWVVDSYNLLYAVLLLTGGLQAGLYGRRIIFMAGAAVFTVASLLCALAPTVLVLICGRALAGIGAALLLPASLATSGRWGGNRRRCHRARRGGRPHQCGAHGRRHHRRRHSWRRLHRPAGRAGGPAACDAGRRPRSAHRRRRRLDDHGPGHGGAERVRRCPRHGWTGFQPCWAFSGLRRDCLRSRAAAS